MQDKTIPPDVTAKEGLLWRNGKILPLPEADAVARAHGWQHAEDLVVELSKPAGLTDAQIREHLAVILGPYYAHDPTIHAIASGADLRAAAVTKGITAQTAALKLDTLHLLSDDLNRDFAEQMRTAVADCRRRPAFAKAREVKISLKITPHPDDSDAFDAGRPTFPPCPPRSDGPYFSPS